MRHDGPALDLSPSSELDSERLSTNSAPPSRPAGTARRLSELLRPSSAPPVLDIPVRELPSSMAVLTEQTSGGDEHRPKGNLHTAPSTEKKPYFPLAQVCSFLYRHACGALHEDAYVDKSKASQTSAPVVVIPSSNKEIDRRERYAQRCPPRLKEYNPPPNFGTVIDGRVFRSAYPSADNYSFLKSLGIRTILTLVAGPPEAEYVQFMAREGIRHIEIHIPANKGEVRVDSAQVIQALKVILEPENYPLHIHCNKGKHRTGCVVGALRKCQGWSMANMISEYHVYADHKARLWDEILLEFFDEQIALSAVLKECLPADGIIPKADSNELVEKPVIVLDEAMIDPASFVEKITVEPIRKFDEPATHTNAY